jgi:hypothetical protein
MKGIASQVLLVQSTCDRPVDSTLPKQVYGRPRRIAATLPFLLVCPRSGDRVLTAIDRDDIAGDAACTIADEKCRQRTDIIDTYKFMFGSGSGLGGQKFVEMSDPTGGSSFDGAGRNRICRISLGPSSAAV